MYSSSDFAEDGSGYSAARGAPRSVLLSRTLSILTLALAVVAPLAACRDASAATASCEQYPLSWRPADGAQAAAQSELAAMSPGATMTWNAGTGTLTAVSVPLRNCTDGQDVGAQVFGVLAAHPALFQLDLSEWRTPEFYDCKYLGDVELLGVGRSRLAGQPVAKDVFAFTLKRVGGVPQLTNVNGTYLPVVGAAMGDAMTACNSLTESAATTTARQTPLHASTYARCQRTGAITYTPKPNDAFSLRPDQAWTWQEDAGRVSLTGQRTLRVTVNPANYTSELMSSDARCPGPGGGDDSVIGFDIVFDVHTGAIQSVKPGLDCIVC
jgi:hypothetical protein